MDNFLFLSFASYRVTKLVIDDEILREPREAVQDRLANIEGPLARKLEYFLECPWCVSIWAAGGLLLLLKLVPSIGRPLVALLAASGASGVLSDRVA